MAWSRCSLICVKSGDGFVFYLKDIKTHKNYNVYLNRKWLENPRVNPDKISDKNLTWSMYAALEICQLASL